MEVIYHRVTIIMPAYNSEKFIGKAIESVQNQTFVNWELIIHDDCSCDETINIVSRYCAEDSRITLIKGTQNLGAAAARNSCLNKATGSLIAFLDADDVWCKDKLEKQVRLHCTGASFSFTGYELIDADGELLDQQVDLSHIRNRFTYRDLLLKNMTCGCSTVMISKAFLSQREFPAIRSGQDYALWLDLLRGGENAILLREPLTRYRIVPGSVSRNKVKKALRQWQIYREFEKLNLGSTLYYFTSYAFRAFFRN